MKWKQKLSTSTIELFTIVLPKGTILYSSRLFELHFTDKEDRDKALGAIYGKITDGYIRPTDSNEVCLFNVNKCQLQPAEAKHKPFANIRINPRD